MVNSQGHIVIAHGLMCKGFICRVCMQNMKSLSYILKSYGQGQNFCNYRESKNHMLKNSILEKTKQTLEFTWPRSLYNGNDLNYKTRSLHSRIIPTVYVEVRWNCCLTSQLTIFQSYMWRHIDVQADWRRSWTYGRLPTPRHFVGFFNVPVLAPTRDHPFYTVIPTHRPI